EIWIRGQGRSRLRQRGGSERSAPLPSSRPSASRTGRLPRTCSANTKGNSGRMGAEPGQGTADNRESTAGKASSWLELGEPERSQRRLRLQVGERKLKRRGRAIRTTSYRIPT